MKTLKNGLMAVLATALSGCAITLQDLRDSNRCVEHTSFEQSDYHEVSIHFKQVYYSIDSPNREFFLHWPSSSGDSLSIPIIGIIAS